MATDPFARLLSSIEHPVNPRPEFAEELLDLLLDELTPDPGLAIVNASLQEDAMMGIAPLQPLAVDSRGHARETRRSDSGRWGDRARVFLATAALVLLTLIGAFFAFGPRQPARHDTRMVLMAPDATPSPPPSASTPLAAFVWEADGGPNFTLKEPNGAALDSRGNLWVADTTRRRIIIFSPDGEGALSPAGAVLEAWGTSGSDEGEFDFSCWGERGGSVAFDAAGNIYVVDAGNFRIQKFAPDRTFLTSWGSDGIADGPYFDCPQSLTVDQQGRVYVADFSGKVEVFAPDGRSLATWTDEINSPRGLAVDGDGNIWVADDSRGVLEFAPDGTLLTAWDGSREAGGELREPAGIAIDGQGRVFVSDLYSASVKVFSRDGELLGGWGERGPAPGQFDQPVSIVLDQHGFAYVVDGIGNRVQKFRLLPPLAPAVAPAP